jgi:hypothetical protein
MTKNVEIGKGGPFVTIAVNYFLNHWPDLVQKLGLTSDNIADMIKSRMGEASQNGVAIASKGAPPVVPLPTPIIIPSTAPGVGTR